MGATEGSIIGYGKSVSEAFNECYQEAEEEHGHEQGYSGAINCTDLARNVTARYKAAKDKNKFIEELYEEIDKGDCYYVELSPPKNNTNKVKSKVIPNPQKGTRKWVTKYVVSTYDRDYGSYNTQTEAIKAARKRTEETQERTHVHIEKHLEKGNSRVASIEYKASTSEKQGKYLFIYVAPY